MKHRVLTNLLMKKTAAVTATSLPYLTFGMDRLLHLPSAEAESVRPSAQHHKTHA